MSVTSANAAQLLDELGRMSVGDRARRMQELGDPERLLQDLIAYASRMTMQDAAKAIEATDIVVNLADRIGSQLDRAKARRSRARALSYTGRFHEALWVCDEGIRLAEEAGNAIEAGRARLASMHALGELGRLDDAIAAGEAARQAFLSAGDQALAARADINIGVVHQRRDDPARALACFERARPLLRDDPLIIGHLENNRGEALLGLNDFRGAQAAYTAALEAFKSAQAWLTAAIAEGNLAELAARQGDLQESLVHFERARRHLENDSTPGHLARLLAERAEAINVLGLPQDALAEYEAALPELDRCGLALEAAKARSSMGQALLRLGRFSEAETALAAAAKAFDDLGHATARAKVDLIRAELAMSNGRTSEARAMVLATLAALENRPAEMVTARHLLARAAMALGRLAEAEAELAIAIAIADDLDLPPLRADVLLTRGLLRRKQATLDSDTRRLDEAIADFSAAIEQVERVRGSLQAERFRAAYLGDRSKLYEWLVQALLDRGAADDLVRAFAVTEQAKSRSLLEQTRPAMHDGRIEHAAPPDTAGAELIADLAQLRSELNGLYSRIGDERTNWSGDAAKAWRAAVRRREQELDALEARLATMQGFGALFARTIDIEQARQSLAPGHAMVMYFIADDELLAMFLTAERTRVYRRLGRLTDLLPRIHRVQFQINRALRPGALDQQRGDRLLNAVRHELAAIDQVVLAPMREELNGVQRLTIVPHGPLHLFPFHALWDGQQYLIEQLEVHYAPSASLLVRLGDPPYANPADPQADGVVVGVADLVAPGIAEEARLVAATMGCPADRVLLGEHATVAQVQEALQTARVAHLACHGRFAVEAAMGSGLKLHDRWLTVRDICRLRLRADLITLSGCETGVNLVKSGDELVGLLRGFFVAGASTLMVSLWRVDDRTTKEFMAIFYRLLVGGARRRSKAAVLREAQLQLLQRTRHPALWAPFIMVGRV